MAFASGLSIIRSCVTAPPARTSDYWRSPVRAGSAHHSGRPSFGRGGKVRSRHQAASGGRSRRAQRLRPIAISGAARRELPSGLSFEMTILSLSAITAPCSRQQSASTSSPPSPSFAGRPSMRSATTRPARRGSGMMRNPVSASPGQRPKPTGTISPPSKPTRPSWGPASGRVRRSACRPSAWSPRNGWRRPAACTTPATRVTASSSTRPKPGPRAGAAKDR